MGTRITLMKDGEIQQIEEPITLYREPVNQFVAEFIGSPSMNIFAGTFRPDGTDYRFEHESFGLRVPPVPGGDSFPDSIALGIRPENLSLADGPSDTVLETHVDLVEPLGSEIYLHGSVGTSTLVARLASEHVVEVGSTVHLVPDPRYLHFFDGSSGLTLRPSVEAVAS